MKMSLMSKTWDVSAKAATYLLAANILLGISVFVLLLMLSADKERIVMMPPKIDSQMMVSWNSASADYYKSWGLYFASLIGDSTPGNADFVADTISRFMDATEYKPLRVKILAFSQANEGGQVFYAPESVVWDPESSKVFVIGKMNVIANASKIGGFTIPEIHQPVVYEIGMKISNGLPRITSIDSYAGSEAHTAEWKEKNKEMTKQEGASK